VTGTEAPWDMDAVTKVEQQTGKGLSLINFSSPFADCSRSCAYYPFPQEQMESVRKAGAIPFFTWASDSTPTTVDEPEFQLEDLIEGKFDSYIRSWATAAKAWGHPFFLRFNWEMNGGWFPWSAGANGNTAAQYVAAWRHVHEIFTSVGATNATWTWCPNVDPEGQFENLASLYPGDEYVDWTCLDGYNWGSDPLRFDKWRTFSSLFSSTYATITGQIAPTKPMVIGEVGSTEYGGSKATWITEMLSELPTNFSKIRGFLWFDKAEEGDWQLDSSPEALSAFATGIQSPVFAGNAYDSLAGGEAVRPAG
jgi:hypothetical protein